MGDNVHLGLMDIIEAIGGEATQAQAQELERRREADDLRPPSEESTPSWCPTRGIRTDPVPGTGQGAPKGTATDLIALSVNPGGKLVSFPERYWPVFGLGGALARVLSI